MIFSARSKKNSASISRYGDEVVFNPPEFGAFVDSLEMPDSIPTAIPGYVKPDINSNNPDIALSTWRYLTTLYLDTLGDKEPYEFYSDEPDTESPEPSKDYIY